MKKILLVIFLLLFLVVVLGFANMNTGQVVSMKFLGLRIEGEFWAFTVANLLIGMVLGWLLMVLSGIKYRVRSRSLEKKLIKSEEKNKELKDSVSKSLSTDLV